MTDQILPGKTAIIYGGGGTLGTAVARTFAREGARVFVAGRTLEPLQAVAAEVGGEAAVVDATDERAVDEHAAAVAAKTGGIDISFSLIFRQDRQGTPIVDMQLADFLHAITYGTTAAFLTARAAARHMREGGVILHLTSGSARAASPGMGNTGPADATTEALMRYLAAELGPRGIRTVGIHTAGVAESLTPEKVGAVTGSRDVDVDALLQGIAGMTMLQRPPAAQQIAETATFLASDRAGAITSGIVNATCGMIAG